MNSGGAAMMSVRPLDIGPSASARFGDMAFVTLAP